MRRFRAPALPADGDTVTLQGQAAHHLARVLCLRPGEPVGLFDGTGWEITAVVTTVGDEVVLTGRGVLRRAAPRLPLHLVLAVLKGPAMDDAIRMATEAGMTDLHPVLTSRTVAQGDRSDRWARIVESAAQQCGRGDLPTLHPVRPLRDVLKTLADVPERYVGTFDGPRLGPANTDAALLIGPEGGLTDAEVQSALSSGWSPASLGPWVLRACTAAAVGIASLA